MITYQEEVFAYFKTLSGSKRIEVMCGLMSMCIPLEVRFLEAVIQDYSKKSLGAFRDAELKANSRQELEHICKCDLLMEKTTKDNDEVELNGNGEGTLTVEKQPLTLTKYPSRSKMIISICLLQSTNHQCSTIVYNYINKHITTENLSNLIYNVYIPKNYPVDGLLNEVLLLLTLAMYHPAFTYEERDLLLALKCDIEKVWQEVQGYYLQRALQTVGAIQQPPTQSPAIAGAPGPQAQAGQATYANPAQHHQHNPSHTQHPQPQSQTVHTYHPYGGQHAVVSSSGKGAPHSLGQPQAHLAPALHPQAAFPISFIQSSVPISNLTPYTPQPSGQAAQVVNHTNAVMQNMSILRINPPPSISSTSPSPTISPSSAKMTVPQAAPNQPPIPIKMDNSNIYTGATTALSPNSVITFVGDAATGPGAGPVPQTITAYMSLPPPHTIIVDDGQQKMNSSVSSNASSISCSCYNCGSVGHLGTECTSGGDENR